MKNIYKWLTVLGLFCFCLSAKAQTAIDLIKQGVDLHNQGKYAEAIDKFEEVLKTDPENGYANYEIAFSLYAYKKPMDAIPHLEKAARSPKTDLSVAAYCLLASIYDENKETPKAIETYDLAIKLNPDYPQIYYNLGIAYFRNQQYAEAENAAIEAIKHNPQNASSQRLYALVTFHQNKRANALLAFCSFILLEPNTARSAEAYANIQHIMQGGVLKDAKGNTTIAVSAADSKENGSLNLAISLAVTAGRSNGLTGVDLLQYELKTIFGIVGELSEKKTDKTFFDQFFAAYFYKLTQSNNMPAFAHTVALTANKDESAKWATTHSEDINAMAEWLKITPRVFQ